MDRRLTGIAIGMCFLLGCTSPVKPSLAEPIPLASNIDLGLDTELGERAEPDEAATD